MFIVPLQTYCSFKWWSNQNKTSEVFAGKKWPKLVTSTGSLKNEQSKKCSDSQPEIYTYFKYVLKMNSQKKKWYWRERIAAIKNLRDESWCFHQLLKKSGRCWVKDYFDSWGRTRCNGRCRCREVWTKAILWTVRQEKTSGRFREDAIRRGSSAYFTIKYTLALLTWYKDVLRARVMSDVPPQSVFVVLLALLYKRSVSVDRRNFSFY